MTRAKELSGSVMSLYPNWIIEWKLKLKKTKSDRPSPAPDRDGTAKLLACERNYILSQKFQLNKDTAEGLTQFDCTKWFKLGGEEARAHVPSFFGEGAWNSISNEEGESFSSEGLWGLGLAGRMKLSVLKIRRKERFSTERETFGYSFSFLVLVGRKASALWVIDFSRLRGPVTLL